MDAQEREGKRYALWQWNQSGNVWGEYTYSLAEVQALEATQIARGLDTMVVDLHASPFQRVLSSTTPEVKHDPS
jgi:hypothetical protein